MIMRMIMVGKDRVLAQRLGNAFALFDIVGGGRMAFSMTTLPTVLRNDCSTSRMGTPQRISEASVRVKRARQILCAMTPKIGSLIRVRSQNSRPCLVLI